MRPKLTSLLSSSLFALSIPAAALVTLTILPARLYAEAGAAPPACTAPEVTACASLATGAGCSLADGGAGVCDTRLCADGDSGTNTPANVCVPTSLVGCASQGQIDDCVGKTAGDTCGTPGGGQCGVLNCTPDGGSGTTLVCLYTGADASIPDSSSKDANVPDVQQVPDAPAEAGKNDAADSGKSGSGAAPSSDDDGCSCRSAGGAPNKVGGAVFALATMLALFVVRRRRTVPRTAIDADRE